MSSIFSGSSRYANDFQQIIDRAVAIASLPISQLTNQKNLLTSQASALSAIDEKFNAIGTAIETLQAAVGTNSFSAAVDDETVAKATVGSGALTGSYEITVLSIGGQTKTLSNASLPVVSNPYTDGITTAASLTLTVGGETFDVVPASQSLAALVDAINSADAGVRATIVNLGTAASPDYRLSVQTEALGDIFVQLNDGSTDLLDTIATGSPATYQIDGQPATPIESDTRSVLISPGLTLDLKKVGTTTVSVSQTSTAVSDALAGFATAFNAAVDELDKHRGKDAGALSGESVVIDLARALRTIAGYDSGGTGITSLASLGLTFDQLGHLNFDQPTFDSSAGAGQLSAVFDFLGDSTSSGFLQAATTAFNNLEDPVDGVIDTAIKSWNDQITKQDDKIAENQARVDLMRETLTTKIAAADALIASLEQQVTLFNGLFEAMKSNNGSN